MNISTNDDETAEQDGEQDEERESTRASKEPGEFVSRAEYVRFVRDLEEDLAELEERVGVVMGVAERLEEVHDELDRLERLHEDHMEMFEKLSGDVQMSGFGKSFGYRRPDAAEPSTDGDGSKA